MPYFIQFVKDLSLRVENVQKSTEDIKKKEETKAEEEMNRPLDMDMNFMFPGMGMQMGGPMAIMPAPGMMPQMQMPGMNMGGMNMGSFMTAPQGFNRGPGMF